MKAEIRKVNYTCGKFVTSIPLEIAKMFDLKKGEYLKYIVGNDGKVSIEKVEN